MTRVIVRHREPGFHSWPQAPLEVSHLTQPHRHVFWFQVEWPVLHDNRDVEFFIAQRWLREALGKLGKDAKSPPHGINWQDSSCELICRLVHAQLVTDERPLPIAIEVWEDGENGARVEFE